MRMPIGIRGAYLLFLGLLPLAVDFSSFAPYEQIKIRLFTIVTDVVAMILVALWARRGSDSAKDGRGQLSHIDLFTIGLLAAYALSTVLSANPGMSFISSFDRGTGLFYWLHVGACYMILRTGAGATDWRIFLRATAVATLVASAYAVAQRMGWDIHGLKGSFALYGRSGPTRAFATLGHPNFLGAWLAMALPLLAYAAAHDPKRSWRRLSLAAAAASGIAVALTYSRGAWIAATAALIAYFVLRIPRTKVMYARIGVAAVLAAAACATSLSLAGPTLERSPNSFLSRVGTTLDFSRGSNLARTNEWAFALSLIAERPFVGYGFDSYMPHAAVRVKSSLERNRDFDVADPSVADRLHNIVLDTAWVGGLLALAMLFGIAIATAQTARRAFRGGGRQRRPLTAAWVAALVAYAVANLVSFDFSISGIWFFLLLAALQDTDKD